MNDLFNQASALVLPFSERAILKEMCFLTADGQVWASIGTLTERTGISRSTVQRAIARLAEGGFLTPLDPAERKFGRGKTKRYRITLPSSDTVSEKGVVAKPFLPEKGVMVTSLLMKNDVIVTPDLPEKGVMVTQKGVMVTPDLKNRNTNSSESLSAPDGAETRSPYERVTALEGVQAWRKIKSALETRINPHTFETWVKPAHGLGTEANKLIVAVPSADFARYLTMKYTSLIGEIVAGLGMNCRVEFRPAA